MERFPYTSPSDPQGLSSHDSWGSSGHSSGGTGSWSIGDAVSAGWEGFKRDPMTLVAANVIGYMLLFAVGIVASMFGAGGNEPTANGFVQFFFSIVQSVATAFLTIGWIRIYVTVARGGKADLSQLFSGGDALLWMVVGNLLVTIGVALGLVLLIVPGIIVALGLALTSFFIADARMPALEAISASWNATRGHKLHLFGFFLVLGLMGIAGALACGVGLLVAMPVAGVAMTTVYLQLTGR